MEPVTLATLTSGAVFLVLEAVKGAASEVGKDALGKIKKLFQWKTTPAEKDLAPEIAKALLADAALGQELLKILQSQPTGTASTLVGSITVDKGSVTVVGTNTGTINNTNTFN